MTFEEGGVREYLLLGGTANKPTAKRIWDAAVAEERERWRQATMHKAGCLLITTPLPPCTCGAHAHIAELHGEAAKAIREQQP